MNIGTALKNLGKTSEAKQYLRKCLELSPQRAQCKQRLAEIGGG
jgi:tetratricopeptide (TPR) repeat protein